MHFENAIIDFLASAFSRKIHISSTDLYAYMYKPLLKVHWNDHVRDCLTA